MTLSAQKQQHLQTIKNTSQAIISIFNAYLHILQSNSYSDQEKMAVVKNVFTLAIDFSGMNMAMIEGLSNEIELVPNFTAEWFINFINDNIPSYLAIIKLIGKIQVSVTAGVPEDKLELNIMFLAKTIHEIMLVMDDSLLRIRSAYYNLQIKLMFNNFFEDRPSNEQFETFIKGCLDYTEIGTNNFRQMYELMLNENMLTPLIIEINKASMQVTENIADRANRTQKSMDSAIEDYERYLGQMINQRIISNLNGKYLTRQNIIEIDDTTEAYSEIAARSQKLQLEFNVIAKLSQDYRAKNVDGKLVANPAFSKEIYFNIDYRLHGVIYKMAELIKDIDKEVANIKPIFFRILAELQSRADEQAALKRTSATNEAGTESGSDDEQMQQIQRQMGEVRLEKQAQKDLARKQYEECKLLVNAKEEQEEEISVPAKASQGRADISANDYQTLLQLFGGIRHDFKAEQLLSLAAACGAKCEKTKSGVIIKFAKNYAIISEAATINVSSNNSGSVRNENPVISFHRQHRADRFLDAGIIAAFKNALEEAGFTPATCRDASAQSRLSFKA